MILMARMPRHIPASPRPSDVELVAALVDATRHLGYREAARAVGVGPNTITRFRRGDWSAIQGETRAKIERYLLRHPAPPSPSVDALTGSQRERAMKRLVNLKAYFDREYAEIMSILREG